jgi:dGTPase
MDWSSLLCRKRLREILDGRPSSSGDDHRTEFEKDYDRVIYSTPFRRLQDKAQVFPLESHDAVHTRLAHSMEVARVAKGLAQNVGKNVILEKEDIDEEVVQEIATIAEVCGLVHDFGNPPFGHAGEEAMRDWFRKKLLSNPDAEKFESNEFLGAGDLTALGRRLWNNGPQYLYDFLRFDGNAHTIRLLSRLQIVAHYRGLNLTAGTMAAALKYLPPSHEVKSPDNGENHPYEKPGYLASEERVVEKVRGEIGMDADYRNPITVLVEAADDIVNSLIDLEDALRKGELTWKEIGSEINDRMEEDENRHDQFKEIEKEAEDIVDRGDAELGRDKGEAYLRMFRTGAVKRHVDAVSNRFEEKYNIIMEGDYPYEILGKGKTSELAEACTDLKFDRVIPSRDVIKLEYMGRNVMQDLMNMFWEGAQEAPEPESDFNDKIYNLSSQNYRSVFENTGESFPDEYQRLQLVADQVCGMTDSYACQLHRELTNR